MELSKRNETVWVIKRTNNPGRFLLKSVEEAGEYLEFSIGMELDKSKLMFEMDREEFENFYKILTNFKNLIDSVPSVTTKIISYNSNESNSSKKVNPSVPPLTEIPQLSLDGNLPPKELIDKSYSHLDDLERNDTSLASLDELDEVEGFSDELSKEDITQSVENPKFDPTPPFAKPNLSSIQQSIPQEANPEKTRENDSEELMAQITEMAAKLHNIPAPKPIASYASGKQLPPKVTLPPPTVSNEVIKTVPTQENLKQKTPESAKMKGRELKESDWDPW